MSNFLKNLFVDPLMQFGNAAGSFWNSITGVKQQQEHNAKESQKQRDWEEEMSSTAYKRAVNDMKNAGLNPAMIYASGGAGMSSTPSGASGSSNIASNQSMVAQIGHLMNSITNATSVDIQHNKRSNNQKLQNMYNDTADLLDILVKAMK